jgi:hypothetical protein
MAINKVPFPASVPAAVSDYQKQNALLMALVKSVDGAQKVVGGNVVQGAVFNVGGTLYVATSDTAISGVASDFVKLTPSGDSLTLAPSYVASLSGVEWNKEYKGYYDVSGNLYEFDEAVAWDSGLISTLHTLDGLDKKKHGKARFLSSSTWRAPTGVRKVWLTGCAAGSPGTAGTSIRGTGGAGGEWGYKERFDVVPETNHSITIGASGSPSSFGSVRSFASAYVAAGGAGFSPAGPDGTTVVSTGNYGGLGGSGSLGGGGKGGSGGGSGAGGSGQQGGYGGGGGGGGQNASPGSGGAGGPAIIIVEW